MAVTAADIATDLGMAAPLEGSIQWNQWTLWISEARLLIAAGPDGHPGFVLADLDQDLLDYVVRKAVKAAALTDAAVTVDSDGVAVGRLASGGRVMILDDWWGLLAPTVGETGSFSVTPHSEPDLPVWPFA